jgi:hypothetical protein
MNYLLVFAIFFGNLAILVATGLTQTNHRPNISVNISITPTPTPSKIPTQIPCKIANPPKRPLPPVSEEPNPENIRATAERIDWDCDGVNNWDDNCKTIFNPLQTDRNRNKIGDACEIGKPELTGCTMPASSVPKRFRELVNVDAESEPEFTADDAKMLAKRMDNDCDGVSNWDDNCRFVYNPKQTDRNKNKIGDACEARKTKRKRSKT